MIKRAIKKVVGQPKRQLVLSALAAAACVIAFGLFFAHGVSDEGGDGIESFRIAFYSMARSFYFNAPVFIGFVFPLFVGILSFIPFKNGKIYLAYAVVLLACGVMVACTFLCYLLPFESDIAGMIEKSGSKTAPEAIAAACLILFSACLCLVKAFSPSGASLTREENASDESADKASEESADKASEESADKSSEESADEALEEGGESGCDEKTELNGEEK